ncbi:protein FAM47E isoform X1 [Ranitomeya imitator]|uniref:protein FAM47E isoform X1 n=1 Tax=Ranitomeya imitator TaxID=111125 RepID=UPI0037E8E8D3
MSRGTGLESSSQPPRYPWYKERLTQKFLKEASHKLNYSGALNTHQWKFLPKGLDDFRDGYPSTIGTLHVPTTKRHALFLQNIDTDSEASQKQAKKFTKEQAYFSKLLPQQQARREYIAGIEYGLAQHPLALYPHLEEGIPPDLFEDIVGILDPEMRLKSASGFYEGIPEEQEVENFLAPPEVLEVQSVKSRDASTRQSSMSDPSRPKNPYKWLYISLSNQEPIPEERKSKTMRPFTPVLDENVKQVTKEFCEWVTSLGGEPCNVNESTIFSLFASGYETKPALRVPIHVVELNNVPPELRMSVGVSPQHGTAKTSALRNECQSRVNPESTYHPSWVKTRYGAWYLDPKTWKRQKVNNPMKDPTIEDDEKGALSAERLSQMDEKLLQLHGTIAFKDFIEKKGYRKPEFLNKLFFKKDGATSDSTIVTESRTASARNTWYRSSSASTHEDSIIN